MSVSIGQPIDLAPLIARGRASFGQSARWGAWEIAFWLMAVATVFLPANGGFPTIASNLGFSRSNTSGNSISQ